MATKTYEVDVGGKTYEVDAPDSNTAWIWANQYHTKPLEQTPPVVPQKKPEAKTSLIRDVPGALIAGTGQLAELPGQLYGLATGDFDTPLTKIPGAVVNFGQNLKSEGLREKERASQERMDAAGKKGFLSGLATGAKEYLTDPALLTSGILQTAPSLIGSVGTGAVVKKGAEFLLEEAAKKAAQESVEVSAKKAAESAVKGTAKSAAEKAAEAGVAGGVGFGAVQQGADVGSNAYTAALSIPQESWDKNPEFKQRVQSGESSDDVKKDMALRVARETAVAAGAISAATGTLLPNTIEKALLGNGVGGNLITRGLKSLAGEATQEGSEEGGGRLSQNIAMRQINPDQKIMEGVGGAAGSAAILGGIMGGGIGAISPGETAAAKDTGAAPAPGAPPPPPPNAPAPDAPAIRTVVFNRAPNVEAGETEPVPVKLDILSEPDEDGIVFVRNPDGGVIQAPLSAIEPKAAPKAAPEAAPEAEAAPEDAPVAEPVAEAAPAAEPVAAVPIDVTEPVAEPVIAPKPEPAVAIPTMPISLSRATPNFNYGTNRFNLAFDNDLDKAVYIATSKTPSNARPKYLEWLDSHGISDPEEIKSIGTRIRADIKDNVRSGANPAEPMRLPAYAAPRSAPVSRMPEVEVAAPTPEAAPITAEPEPTTEATPENEPQVFTPELAKELNTYDPKLSKELVGKTVAGAMRHVANRSKADLYKSLGNRIANMVDVLQNNGMKFTFSVLGEPDGMNPNADNTLKVGLSKPGVSGRAITSGVSGAGGYERVDIGVRGKPLPNEPDIGANEQTVIHEGLHAVTAGLISLQRTLPKGSRAEKAVKEINELYKTVIKFRDKAIADGGDIGAKAKNLKDTTNAFKDSHELVSWGLTNYDMQSFLKDVPVEGGNAFTKFVRIIGKMLGVGEKDYNALRRLIEISENLIPEDVAGQTEVAKAVVSPYAQGKAKAASVVSPSETVVSERLFNKQPPKEPPPPPGETTQQPGGPQATPQINIPLGQEKFMAKMNRLFADRLDRLHYVQRQIEAATGRMMPRSERTTEKASVFDSRAQARLDDLKRDYEDKIIKIMADLGISQNEADLYLLARTAPARNAKIAKRNPNIPDGGSGRTNAEAKAMMDDLVLTGRMPKMQKLGKLVDQLVREKLKLQVEYGLLSQQQVDNWLADEPFYVPLKGVALGEDMSADGSVQPTVTPTGRGFSITPKETKIAKGRSTLPLSPLANLMSDARGVIVRGERNRVGQSFLNDIANKFQSNAWQVFTDSNPDMTQVMNPKTGKFMDVPVQMASPSFRDTYFVVKENGKPSYIKIPDTLLMRALTNGSAKEVSALNKFLGSTIGVATKMLSRLHTTLNPEFFVTNAFRDVQAAVFNILAEQDRVDGRIVGKKILTGFLKDVSDPRNFRDLFKATYNHSSDTAMSKLLQQAKKDGALTGWIVNETPQEQIVKIEKALAKANATGGKKAWYSTIDGLNSVKNAVEDFNSIFENTTRLAVYKNALEALEQGYKSSGISEADASRMAREEAANMARNVTVDFNRKGELGPTFNALFAFANAAVQGNVQLYRSLSQNPFKHGPTGAQKLVLGMVALGMLQAAMGAGMSDDDDDGKSFYDKIPDYEKERNLIFMKPDGKGYIKIPLPYGYSFFHNLGANLAELPMGKKDPGKFASSMFGSLMGNFSPLSTGGGSLKGVAGTAVPTVIRPFYDLAINENFFGGSIYNEPFDKNQAASSVSKYSTPEGYKAVAEFLNSATGGVGKVKGAIDVSPEAIQYLINQAVGGTGKVAFNLIDLGNKEITGQKIGVSDVPILRKVIGEPSKYADLGDYYDRVTKISPIEAQLKSSKGIERQAIREKFPLETNPAVMAAKKQAESRMRAINKRKKLITNRNMDGDERRDQMDKLNELQTKAYVRFNTVYNRVEKEERGR